MSQLLARENRQFSLVKREIAQPDEVLIHSYGGGLSGGMLQNRRGSGSKAEPRRFNRKRRIVNPRPAQQTLNDLARKVRYVGSPYHKRNPGDFALTPAAQPRPDAMLCDGAGIVTVSEAQRLLKKGARKGLVSDDPQGTFPKHIWASTNTGIALEATLSNAETGEYHGYPLFDPDPFREVVLRRWNGPEKRV